MSERGGYRCCVKGCQSATSNKRGIKETLFKFPKDAERLVYYVTCLVFTVAFKADCMNCPEILNQF